MGRYGGFELSYGSDADVYFEQYFRTGGSKRINYNNPEFDKLVFDAWALEATDKKAANDVWVKAQRILHPYTLDVKEVPWWSVYEIGQRICDKYDDVPAQETGTPVFKSPYRSFVSNEYGLTFSDPGGRDWALEGSLGHAAFLPLGRSGRGSHHWGRYGAAGASVRLGWLRKMPCWWVRVPRHMTTQC